jgi:hypothetical protein
VFGTLRRPLTLAEALVRRGEQVFASVWLLAASQTVSTLAFSR